MAPKADEKKLRPYETPVLMTYGAMATLTASGTFPSLEVVTGDKNRL
jgi:hypothetical protein